MTDSCSAQSDSRERQPFLTTQWSLVAAAGEASSPATRAALAELCQRYWYPLYAYVRHRGWNAVEAQDLTQAFFAELLEKNRLQAADRERGRFRSFLLSSLNHFLSNQWRDARRLKRGGGQAIVSLDFADGESRFRWEPVHEETPERIFQRRWAMTLLDGAMSRLCTEYEQAGKLPLFERLKAFIGGDPASATYREIAEQLNLTEGAVKTAAHRLRRRAREVLRDEISQTVATEDDIDAELQELFHAVER